MFETKIFENEANPECKDDETSKGAKPMWGFCIFGCSVSVVQLITFTR